MANRFDNVPGLPQLYQQQSMVVDKPFIGTEVPNSPLNIPLDLYKDKYKDNLKLSQGVDKELDDLQKTFKPAGKTKIRGIDGRELYVQQDEEYKKAMKEHVFPIILEARNALKENDYTKANSLLSQAQQEYNSNDILTKVRDNDEHFKKQEAIFAEKGDDPNEVLKQEAANEQFYKDVKINPAVATLEAVGREKQLNAESILTDISKGLQKDASIKSAFDFDEAGNKWVVKTGSEGVGPERVQKMARLMLETDTNLKLAIKQHAYNYGTKLDFTFDNLRTNNKITNLESAKKYLDSNPSIAKMIMQQYGISSPESVANMLSNSRAKQFDFLKTKEQRKYVNEIGESFVSKFGYSSSKEFSNVDWYNPGTGSGTAKDPDKGLFTFDQADLDNYRKDLFSGTEQFSDKAMNLIGSDGNFKTDTPQGRQMATLFKANEPIYLNAFENVMRTKYGYNPAEHGGKNAFQVAKEWYKSTNPTKKDLTMTQFVNMVIDNESTSNLIDMPKGADAGSLHFMFEKLKLKNNPIGTVMSGDTWFGKNTLAETFVDITTKDHSSLGIIDSDKQLLTGLWAMQSSDVSNNVNIGHTKVYKNGEEVTTSERTKALAKGNNGTATANDLNGFRVTSFGELGKNSIQLTTSNGDYSIVTTYDKNQIGKAGSPANKLVTTYAEKMKDVNQFTEIFSANNNYASVYKNFELNGNPGDVTEVPNPNQGYRNFMYKDDNGEVYTVPIKTGVYELDKTNVTVSQIKQIVQNNESVNNKDKSAYTPKEGIVGFNYYGTDDQLLTIFQQVKAEQQAKANQQKK